jgi:hypothetical protein
VLVSETYEREVELTRLEYTAACDEGRVEWPRDGTTVYLRIQNQDYRAHVDDVEAVRNGQRVSLVFTWHRTWPWYAVPHPMTPEREARLEAALESVQAARARRKASRG